MIGEKLTSLGVGSLIASGLRGPQNSKLSPAPFLCLRGPAYLNTVTMAAKQTSYDALLAAGFRKADIHRALHALLLTEGRPRKSYRFLRAILNARNARKPKNPV